METRTVKLAAYVIVALVGGITLEAAAFFVPISVVGWERIIAFTGFVFAAVAWGAFFSVKAHHQLDEFQRESAKNAVYWGVTVGVVASAPIYAFVEMGGLQRLAPDLAGGKTLAIAFASGYGLALIFITLGICIAAAWLRRGQV